MRLVAGDSGGSLGHQGRAWQPQPTPSPQPGAGQPGDTGAAPAPGTCHLPGDWGGDTTGLGHGPVGGVHVPDQQRTWHGMGIAVQHLQQSSGGEQAGEP